ncbi:hypothetical protein OH492_13915 [Vibrio chagasii]|nr:hypothetical protein [Vibrio chagasii]
MTPVMFTKACLDSDLFEETRWKSLAYNTGDTEASRYTAESKELYGEDTFIAQSE